MTAKSDSELDSIGLVKNSDIPYETDVKQHEHEWSEWHTMAEIGWQQYGESTDFGVTVVPTAKHSRIKIRVCKRCKKAEFDLI